MAERDRRAGLAGLCLTGPAHPPGRLNTNKHSSATLSADLPVGITLQTKIVILPYSGKSIYHSYRAIVRVPDGKGGMRTAYKSYSIGKYGDAAALELAVAWREERIRKYSPVAA